MSKDNILTAEEFLDRNVLALEEEAEHQLEGNWGDEKYAFNFYSSLFLFRTPLFLFLLFIYLILSLIFIMYHRSL